MKSIFEEQDLLDDTKYILFGLFEKFGATELQKEKIKAFKNNYYIQILPGIEIILPKVTHINISSINSLI